MFIPDPDFFPYRISDPGSDNNKKEKRENNCCLIFFRKVWWHDATPFV
jgi:hypothetical protein